MSSDLHESIGVLHCPFTKETSGVEILFGEPVELPLCCEKSPSHKDPGKKINEKEHRQSMSLFLRREQDQGHPELRFFDFDLRRLLDRTKNTFSSLVSTLVEVCVQSQPTLACIRTGDAPVSIHLHSVLNHPTTPERVIAFILCHELLHLIIPPREVSGKCSAHPPEFWDAEQDMLPDRSLAYGWLILVLGSCLKRDKEQECTFVKTNWKKQMNGNRPTMDQIAAIRDCSKSVAQDKEEPLL